MGTADEPHDGFLIREDAGDVGSALDLLIQPLQWIWTPFVGPRVVEFKA
jgi:hypothetical protein